MVFTLGNAEDDLKAFLQNGPPAATSRVSPGPTATSTSTSDPMVYLGLQHDPVMRAAPPGSSQTWMRDDRIGPYKVASTSSMMEQFWQMSPTKKRRLAKKLWLAGLVSGATYGVQDANIDDIANAYMRLLGMSADRFQAGKAVTPMQMLDQAIEFIWGKTPKGANLDKVYERARKGFSLSDGGSGDDTLATGPKYPITTKSKNTVIDLSSPAEAKAFLRSSMMTLLGRDPSEEEVEDFVSMLNSHEQDNPATTMSKTTTFKAGNSRTRTRVIDDGFTSAESAELAEDEVMSRPGYAEYQAATTYLPALWEMLGPVA
jgi:hypothetical protein